MFIVSLLVVYSILQGLMTALERQRIFLERGELMKIVYQHHEHLDGSIYPRGLTEDDMLLDAKILAVADLVEAVSSHRHYRPSLV
ncbi:MAG: HD domain-containing phosphohydrolase [Desulforhopalus sp.]